MVSWSSVSPRWESTTTRSTWGSRNCTHLRRASFCSRGTTIIELPSATMELRLEMLAIPMTPTFSPFTLRMV